jgi:hypothetical protein
MGSDKDQLLAMGFEADRVDCESLTPGCDRTVGRESDTCIRGSKGYKECRPAGALDSAARAMRLTYPSQ